MATFLRVWTLTVLTIPLFLFADEEERFNTFTPPTPEERLLEFKEAFERIDSTIKSEDFDTAARLLALALQHSSDARETALVQDGALLVPVFEAVSRRLSYLPKDSLQLFKTLTEPQARRAFQHAKEKKSLLSLIRRYPFSETALTAAELLLDTALECGDALSAISAISFLTKRGATSDILRLKRAVANSLIGRSSPFKDALAELPIAPEKKKFFRDFLSQNRPSKTIPPLNTYPFMVLNLRLEECEIVLKGSSVEWKKDIRLGSKQRVYPLLLGGRIYIADISSLTVVEAASGEILTTHRFTKSDPRTEEKHCPIPGVLATDGRYIYGSFWSEEAASPHLYALTTDGKTVWSTDGTYDPFLNRVYVCGAPLLHNGTVFVTATLRKNNDAALYLLAFSTDGDFLWRTHIGSTTLIRTARRALRGIRSKPEPLPPVTLSADGQTVFFCTNSGALGAVDSSTGTLEWILLYPIYRERRKETITFYGDDEAPAVLNPPILKSVEFKGARHDVIIAAPADTNRIVGVNLKKKTAFWVSRYRTAFIFPFGDAFVALESEKEKNRITLLHPPTAKVLWRSNLDEPPLAPPAAIFKDAFLLPLKKKVLLLGYDASRKRLERKKEIEVPKLREKRFEGRFPRRRTLPLYTIVIIFKIDESMITFNSGILASSKKKK